MTIIIKEITEKSVTKDTLDQLVTLLQQLSTSVSPTLVDNAIRSPQNHILIALEVEKIVGTATMGYMNCVTGVRAHIEDVVVDETYRGQGIATLLINGAVDRAKNIGAKSIDLTSRPEREAANRLYKKLGFVQRDTNVYRYSQS